MTFVPASHDNPRTESVLVLVDELREEVCCRDSAGLVFLLNSKHAQVVRDNVGDGLRVSSTAGSTAVDAIRDVRKLVRHTIGLTRA